MLEMGPTDKRNFATFLVFSYFLTIYGQNWGPTNVRGYIHYPKFGPWDYTKRKLEVIFDYDPVQTPNRGLVEVECSGYRNCVNWICATSDWTGNRTGIVKPYQAIFFDVPIDISRYSCRARISDSEKFRVGSWSPYGIIDLPYSNSVIYPKPSLVVCQALEYPPENYGRSHLIRILDVDAANTPNETAVQTFDLNCNLAFNGQGSMASYETPLCFDWIANWQYRLNRTNNRCLVKVDTLYMKSEVYAGCHDARIQQLQCYSPLALLFFTTAESTATLTQLYRLYRYDMKTGTSRVIVDNTDTTSKGCKLQLSHYWLSLDWRPYWVKNITVEANLVFLSEHALWIYNIEQDMCQKMIDFHELGLPDFHVDDMTTEILQFDMDWKYFYWINGTTYDIHAISWKTGQAQIFDKIRIFDAEKQERKHNLSHPIYNPMNYMVSLAQYSPATRPYPLALDCLIPDLRVTVTITNGTNAIVTIEKVWNISHLCLRTNKPPPQLTIRCVSVDADEPCEVGVSMYRGREERYTTELKKLVQGYNYNVTIEVSIIGNDQLSRTVTEPFVAEMPKTVDRTWERDLSIGVAVACILIFSALATVYFVWYRKRKAMRVFLRRERIDASELTLVKQIGQGEFGEVWLAQYCPSGHESKTRPVFEVALKMRKSSNFNYKSTLLSADCFFQEAVALNFLRHPHIIVAYGLCMNFKKLPPILVLEYMNGGNCMEFVKTERRHLTSGDLAKICRDIIRACMHLANKHVVHKDIGARNVLIRKNLHTGKPEVAKLTDFGLARDVGKRECVYASTNKETVFHIYSTAPEGFEGRFSSQSDVWSFGIFVWELYSLLVVDDPVPYSNLKPPTKDTILTFLKSGRTLENPRLAPSEVCILMRQCWALEPTERPTFRQLNAAWRLIGNHAISAEHRQYFTAYVNQEEVKEESPENIQTIYGVMDGSESPEVKEVEAEDRKNGYTEWQASMEEGSETKLGDASRILFQEYIGGYKEIELG